MSHVDTDPAQQQHVLGLDAGGTSTRWALANVQGQVQHEGQVAGLSGLMLASEQGKASFQAVLGPVAEQCQTLAHGQPVAALCMGLTGFDGDDAAKLAQLLTHVFAVRAQRQRLFNDVELACRAAFAPGQGYLVYAGTGSVAAYVDEQEQQHRAGGRGGLIDDGGSGYWIAREALRHIWRAEDESPGTWAQSAMARAVFEHIGGHSWAASRSWVYAASRGDLGQLAVAVARAADEDPAALGILQCAGQELARLGWALLRRCGPRPLALAGRVFDLHPAVERATREALAGQHLLPRSTVVSHHAAARLAANWLRQGAAISNV